MATECLWKMDSPFDNKDNCADIDDDDIGGKIYLLVTT